MYFIDEITAPPLNIDEDRVLTKQELEKGLGIDVDYPRFVEVLKTPIFKEGTWNGGEYTRADIMEMAQNYHRMKNTWTPTLKISHDQGYHLTDTGDSEKAHGRVTDMWEDSGVLYANFEFGLWFYKSNIAEKRLIFVLFNKIQRMLCDLSCMMCIAARIGSIFRFD